MPRITHAVCQGSGMTGGAGQCQVLYGHEQRRNTPFLTTTSMYNYMGRFHQGLHGTGMERMHEALEFPRMPPGSIHPRTNRFAIPPRGVNLAFMPANLDDFQEAYKRQVQSLLDNAPIIPPGHPMYDKHVQSGILRQEKEKLLKENVELKRQLDEARSRSDAVLPHAP